MSKTNIFILKFYNYIYYNIYFAKKENTSIDSIVFTSLCQTFNLLTFVNFFLFFTKFLSDYDIPMIYLLTLISLLIINSYYYKIMNKEEELIKGESYSLGRYSFLVIIFFFLSVFLAMFSYYILKEW